MRAHLTVPLSLVLTAGCAAALTAATPTSATPKPAARALPVVKVLNIKTLPLGAKLTKVAYLDRNWKSPAHPTLHRPGKATVSLPLAWRDAAVALLGKGQHGYVVVNQTGTGTGVRLYNVTDTGAHQFYSETSGRYWGEARLTLDGAAVVVSGVPDGEASMVARRIPVAGAPGPEVVIGLEANGPDLIGATGSVAVFPQWYAATRVWRFGIGVEVLTAYHAVQVDGAHHRLFIDTNGAGAPLAVGPTSLGSPSAPAWTANFSPQIVSPDGKLVAGWVGDLNLVLQVRRVSDGTVVAKFTSATETVEGDRLVEPLVWEANATLLLKTWTGADRWAVIRCTMAGSCARATKIRDGMISFPVRDHPYGWWLY